MQLYGEVAIIQKVLEVIQGALPSEFDAIFSGKFSNTHNDTLENGKYIFLQH